MRGMLFNGTSWWLVIAMLMLFGACGIGECGQANTGKNDKPDPLAPLQVQYWQGTIEVTYGKNESVLPITKKADVPINWESGKNGSITTSETLKADYKAKLDLKVSKEVYGIDGTVDYRYTKNEKDFREQQIRCRPKGGNSYFGWLRQTLTTDTNTNGAKKNLSDRVYADCTAGACNVTIQRVSDGWHIRVYVGSKSFDTEVARHEKLVGCEDKIIRDFDLLPYKSNTSTETIDLDVSTKETKYDPKKLKGTVKIPVAGVEYKVTWDLVYK